MSLESILEKIKLLEKRASSISDNSDSYRKELVTNILLHDYMKVEPRSPLEFYVKSVLSDYLSGKDPFPLTTENLKIGRGNLSKKIEIAPTKLFYFSQKTSINKTSKMLGISRKSISTKIAPYHKYIVDENFMSILNDLYCTELEELLSSFEGGKK